MENHDVCMSMLVQFHTDTWDVVHSASPKLEILKYILQRPLSGT
jgi:hypothetical protein